MKRAQVFDLYMGNKFLGTGTIKELSEQTKIGLKTLYKAHVKESAYKLVLKGKYKVVYEVFTNDGVICRGSKKQCSERAYLSEGSIAQASRQTRLGKINGKNGGYMIRRIGWELVKEGAEHG